MKYSSSPSKLSGRAFAMGVVFSIILSFQIHAQSNCVSPPSGLVGWWRGEGNLVDQLGTNHGTLVGNTTFDSGRVGQAFVFDGDHDAVALGNRPELQLQTLTIEAWIKRSSTSLASLDPWQSGGIFGCAWGGYTLGLWDDGRLLFGKVGYSAVSSTFAITDSTNFHHVAVTKTGSNVVFYLDGVAQAVGPYDPGFVFSSTIAIGARGDDYASGFLGAVDEVSVYNRALSTTEVQAIYSSGSAGKCMPGDPASIVVNGGLELLPGDTFQTVMPGSSYAGWRSAGTGDIEFDGTYFQPKAQGLGCVDLNGIAYQGAIAQTLTNEPGVLYRLRFAMSGNPGAPGENKRGDKAMTVSWGGTNVGTFVFQHLPNDTWSNMRWEYHDILLNGTGQDELRYTSTTAAYNDAGPVIDDISLVPIRDPFLSIITHPSNQEVSVGGTANFHVVAIGTQPLSYQWRFNGTNVDGATNSSLALANVQVADAGVYSVAVSNLAGTATSSNAVLTVNPSPAAVLWNVNFAAYEEVKTGWAATGMSASDFWNRYTAPWQEFAALSNLKLADGTPTAVGLTVQNGAGHWGFDHPDLMYNSYCYARDFGTITLTLTNLPTGEYDFYLYGHAGADRANTVFQLLVGGADWGMQSTTTNGSWALTNWVEGAQHVVYRNVAVTNGGAPLVVKAHPGLSRYTHLNGLQILSAAATPPSSPVITAHPQSQSVTAGANVTFTVTATGTAPLSYQWRYNGTNLSGATASSLVLANVSTAEAGNYSIVVSNVAGTATSSNAVLTVNPLPPCAIPPSGLVGWWKGQGNALDEVGANHGTLLGQTTFSPGRVGQGFVFDGSGDGVRVGNSTELRLQNFTIEAWIRRTSTSQASLDFGGGAIFAHGHGGYSLGMLNSGTLFLSRVGIDNVMPSVSITDTNVHHVAVTKSGTAVVFYVDGVAYSVPPYNTSYTFSSPAAIGARGDNLANSFLGIIDEVSVYNRPLAAGEVQAIYGAAGSGKCDSPPFITSHPADQTVTVGANVTFSVAAGGSAPLSYQWRFNGTNMTDATANSLLLTNVQFADAGDYSVMVSNVAGVLISSNGTLTVTWPPASLAIISVNTQSAGTVALPVVLTANGNENALGFSLSFNQSLLSYADVTLGNGATGGALLVNTKKIGNGKLGVAVALPAGATFPAGSHEIVLIGFTTAIVTSDTSTPVSFGDVPISRQMSDAPGNILAANYIGGSVSIGAVMYEGDVSPRPNGDRITTITDWVLAGRYAARLDYPTNATEFQRADCAPRTMLGDGAITVTDWVQAGRYAAALDPLTPVGGPSFETPEETAANDTVRATGDEERAVSVSSGILLPNQTASVGVQLKAEGSENALGFSLSYDPGKLTYVGAAVGSGSAGATLNVNASQAGSGKLGFVMALGMGSQFSAGTHEVVKVDFTPANTETCEAVITVTDIPVRREVSDANATKLPASYVSGTMAVNPLPVLEIVRVNDDVRLSWPLWASNFVLQTIGGAITPTATWTNVPTVVETANDQRAVVLPAQEGWSFYRLYRQ